MPPKLNKAPAPVDGGTSVLERIKAQKAEQEQEPVPVPAAKRSLKAKQSLELDRKGTLDVLALLSGVRSGEVRWCRKCADLFDPQASETQQCPKLHPNFTYVKPAPELKSQLEEAEAHFIKAATTVQSAARGRTARRQHGPAGRAATRLQCATRQRAAKRAAQRQRARRRIEEGKSALSARKWEVAVEKFKAGLAVEGTRDEDLTTTLRDALLDAESSLAARDAARDLAEAHLVEATSLTSSRDYAKAIGALQAALQLDAQSDDLKERLQASLAAAEAALAQVEAAKKQAAELVSTGQGCMSSHDYSGAIAAYEAAMALDVNDNELAGSFQAGLTVARAALAAAVETARGRLADGESYVSVEDWEAAIESLQAGLAVRGTHDEKLTASLRTALQGAESSKAARDAAATAAEAERQRIVAEEAEAERRRQQEEAEQARRAAASAEAEAAAEAARIVAAADADKAAEAARLTALSVQHTHHPSGTPTAAEIFSQVHLPTLPEGLPPLANQALDIAQSSADLRTAQWSAQPSTHDLFQPQPEPEPEPQRQPTRVAASDTPMFDLLMASAGSSLPVDSTPHLLAQTPVSTDTKTTMGVAERGRLAAATAQSLMASPTHCTIVAEEQLEAAFNADLKARRTELARERIEQQELEKELAEAEIWGISRTSALLREDAKERRQRRLRLGPYGETRGSYALKAYGSAKRADQQPLHSMDADVRYRRDTRDAHVHEWVSRATDSATETATTATEDTSFVGTDASDDEVWPNPSGDSLSYADNQLSSEDDGQDSEYNVNGFRADRHWQDARHRVSHHRPATLESRATRFSQHVDFGVGGQRHPRSADEHDSDSLQSTLVSQLADSDAPSSLCREESLDEIEDGKTEAWGTLNEILVNKIVELAQLNAKVAATTKHSGDRAAIKSEAARVALATAMDLQATAARVSVGAADIQQMTSPLRCEDGRRSAFSGEQRAGRGISALDFRVDHRRSRTRHHSHNRSRSPSPSRSRTRRHHRRHRSRSRSRSQSRSRSHRRHRSRRDDESSYSDEDDGTSGSSRSPHRSSHRRHKSPRSHRSEQSGHRGRSARSHKKSSRTRSRRHQSQHSSKGEDCGEIDQEVRKPPAAQGGSLAHIALLGSLEAGEQQLELRKAALAHALEVARTAEAKHAAEARRLREHYGFPDDDGEDVNGSSSGRQSASQHYLHGESAVPIAGIDRAAPPLRSARLESPVRGYAATRRVTYAANARSAEDGEPEDSDESEALLLKIDAVAPIGRWPDWAVAMLRARKFTSHQEVLVLGIFMYANGVRRDVISEWLRTRYRTERVVEGERQPAGALPSGWLKRLQSYLDRVDWQDPTLWTYSLAADDLTYLDGRVKSTNGAPQGLLGVVARWSQDESEK